jgi:hypothetical protein
LLSESLAVTTHPIRRIRCRARSVQALPWLLAAALLAFSLPASGDGRNWFVRSDGGDASQCDGRSDAPYTGNGSARACAWRHPFIALPPGGAPRIAGGDTLVVGPGDYMMGIGAPDTERCEAASSRHCHMPPIPSGPSPERPTRLLGAGHDRGCPAAPQLWGSERAELVLNLHGASNIEIACFEITDRAACIEHHCNRGNCQGEVAACRKDGPPFGPWAYFGLSAHDSSNVLLRDLTIHGMAASGIRAGRLHDWTSERLTLRANGWAGWDGDIGGNSANSGQIVFREAHIAWNGCAERHPGGEIFGCWAGHGGGYGDGLGTAETGGHWRFEDSIISHNTSDGLDLLYLDDNGSLSVVRSWFEGNAGNQLKARGRIRVENSVVVGNCGYFAPAHRNMGGNDHCRSHGNALSLGMFADSEIDLVNNTISSEGDCLLLTAGGGTAARLNVINNVLLGEPDWRRPERRSCVHYSDGGSEAVRWERNFVGSVRYGACPAGSLCGSDAPISSRHLAAFDPTPKAGAAIIDAASAALAPDTDYYNYRRHVGAGPDIGAIELGAADGAAGQAPGMARIASVELISEDHGDGRRYLARVRVVDAAGNAQPAVTVHGQWRNAGVQRSSAVSGADGIAELDGGNGNGSAPRVCASLTPADPRQRPSPPVRPLPARTGTGTAGRAGSDRVTAQRERPSAETIPPISARRADSDDPSAERPSRLHDPDPDRAVHCAAPA